MRAHRRLCLLAAVARPAGASSPPPASSGAGALVMPLPQLLPVSVAPGRPSESAVVGVGILGFLALPLLGALLVALGSPAGPVALPIGLCLGACAVLALPPPAGGPASGGDPAGSDIDG